jgi:hypothetical protein
MASKSDLPSSVPDTTSRGGSTGPEETDGEGAGEGPSEGPSDSRRADDERSPGVENPAGPGEQADWQPPFDLAPVEMDVSIVPVKPDDPDRRRRKREVREKQEQAEKYLRAIGHVKPPHASSFRGRICCWIAFSR